MDALRVVSHCSRGRSAHFGEELKKPSLLQTKHFSFGQKYSILACHQGPQHGKKDQTSDGVLRFFNNSLQHFNKTLVVAAASFALMQSPCSALSLADAISLADETAVGYPSFRFSEISDIQKTLVQAWGIVRDNFFDPTFNKQDWNLQLKEALKEALNSEEAVHARVRNMLATLGDPYTRIITPQEYENFRIGSDGAVDGVGMLLSSEHDSGRLFVLSTVEGGPAERAGMRAGDEIVKINDEAVLGLNGEDAAKRLRGRAGTVVDVKFRRTAGTDLVKDASELKEVKMTRQKVALSPVFTALLPHKNSAGDVIKTGYIRLSSFSQNAGADVKKAIAKLEESNAESYILDLRHNPGGLLRAGLDVAEMWLDGNETIVNTIDRRGNTLPINIANGHALTHDPLVVLVDEDSASASEILAAALKDNGRALIVGHRTYGKGKIQSISTLEDGSALFVTVAKYLSPALHQIDQVGITPDLECSPLDASKSEDGSKRSPGSALERDACVLVAERALE